MREAGNAVIVVGRTCGRMRASGKPFDVSIVHVCRIRDQKIVSFEPHIDTRRCWKLYRNIAQSRCWELTQSPLGNDYSWRRKNQWI
jgi:hypothetical protein